MSTETMTRERAEEIVQTLLETLQDGEPADIQSLRLGLTEGLKSTEDALLLLLETKEPPTALSDEHRGLLEAMRDAHLEAPDKTALKRRKSVADALTAALNQPEFSREELDVIKDGLDIVADALERDISADAAEDLRDGLIAKLDAMLEGK